MGVFRLFNGVILLAFCLGIGIGLAGADQYGDTYNTGLTGQQGSGIAEPFYPAISPSSPQGNSGSTPLVQIGPGTGQNPGNGDPVFIPTPTQTPIQNQVTNPVSSPSSGSDLPNFGNAEPFYPSTPPSPAPLPTSKPVSEIPIQPQNPGIAEPYYPNIPPTPQPTPYTPSKQYRTPVYYEPDHGDDSRYRPWYNYRNYPPTYRDTDDWYWYDHSYVDGILKVASEPYQAEVFIDNRFRGYTPYSGYLTLDDMRPGTYTLKLKYSGYYDFVEDVYVAHGRTTYIDAEMVRVGEKQAQAGSLSVQSDPSGVNVYLDNAYRGISPVVIGSIPLGSHTLLLRKEGYSDYKTTFDISDKQTISISASLTPVLPTATPTLAIATTPVLTPVPVPTKSGIPEDFIVAALIVGGIFFVRRNRPRI